MEGEIKRDDDEEEPEGEVVAGPSGEATVYSSGNIPLSLSLFSTSFHQPYFTTFYYIILLHDWMDWHPESCLPLTSWLILLTDESDEEKEVVTWTKEEQELGVVQSWMEVGGLPALPEEESLGLLCKVFPLLYFF